LTKSAVVGLMPRAELTPVFSPADCASAGFASNSQPSAMAERFMMSFEKSRMCFLHKNKIPKRITRATFSERGSSQTSELTNLCRRADIQLLLVTPGRRRFNRTAYLGPSNTGRDEMLDVVDQG